MRAGDARREPFLGSRGSQDSKSKPGGSSKPGSAEGLHYQESLESKKTAAKILHLWLLIAAFLWSMVNLLMLERTANRIHGSCTTQSIAVGASVVLFLLQLKVFAFAWCMPKLFKPLYTYKLGMLQVLVNTFVTFFALTTYLFHAKGLNLVECFFNETCTTNQQDASFAWKEVFHSEFGPNAFDQVSIKLSGNHPTEFKTFDGNQFGSLDGLSVRIASPLSISFGVVTKGTLVACFMLWAVATSSIILFVIRINSSGRSKNGPGSLEMAALASCLGLIVLSMVNFCIHHDGVYAVPIALGFATFFPLRQAANAAKDSESRRISPGSASPATSKLPPKSLKATERPPLSAFEKREDTVMAAVALTSFTYIAGLLGCFAVCDTASVWPTNLEWEDSWLFGAGVILSFIATVGYWYSISVALKMVQYQNLSELRAPQRPEDPCCQICEDYVIESALQPCGHACMCWPCSQQIMRSRAPRCPICRHRIDDMLKVYI